MRPLTSTTSPSNQYEAWRQVQAAPKPTATLIRTRFRSWGRACKKARLKSLHNLSDRQLLRYIKQATKELGQHPTQREYQQWARQSNARPSIHILSERYSFATQSLKPAEAADDAQKA